VWHQSLLCFAQRYKREIRAEDKVALRKLADAQHHYQIGPEVKRELAQGRSRGEVDPEEEAARAAAEAAEGARRRGHSASALFAGAAKSSSAPSRAAKENPRDMPEVAMLDDDAY